jgi:signal recognition particle receptor subunit beta
MVIKMISNDRDLDEICHRKVIEVVVVCNLVEIGGLNPVDAIKLMTAIKNNEIEFLKIKY